MAAADMVAAVAIVTDSVSPGRVVHRKSGPNGLSVKVSSLRTVSAWRFDLVCCGVSRPPFADRSVQFKKKAARPGSGGIDVG
jgi:hypothetical protein